MPKWRSKALALLHLDRRGQAALELALALPLLLLFMGAAVDFGMAYETVQRLGGAARLGAQAAADAMTGQPLGGGVSGQAQQAALAAVKQALPDLANEVQVTVQWDGTALQTNSTQPAATLTVTLPQVQSQTQTLNFQTTPQVPYLEPTFTQQNLGQWNSAGASYSDTINQTTWQPASWSSQYGYWDLNNYATWGNGGGCCLGNNFDGTWGLNPSFYGWSSNWLITGLPYQQWYRYTNWTTGSSGNWASAGTTWQQRRMQTPSFFQNDYTYGQSGWTAAQATANPAGPVTQITYATNPGSATAQFQSQQTSTMTTRLVRVTVTVPATPITPIMAPILGGHPLSGFGDAAATTAQ